MNKRDFFNEAVFLLKKLYWFIFRPRTSGVKCVLEKQDSVFMLHRNFGTDKWVFPGGAIKKDESPEEAVIREINEDLGITLSKLHSIGSFAQTVHHRQETLYCFVAKWESEVSNYDKTRINGIRWFNKSKLPFLTPVSKSVVLLLEKDKK